MKTDAMEAIAGQWYYSKRHNKMLCITEAHDEELPGFAVRHPITGQTEIKFVEGEIEWLPACEGWDWPRRRRVEFDDPYTNTKVVAQEVLPEDPETDMLLAACHNVVHTACFVGDPVPEELIKAIDTMSELLENPLGCIQYDHDFYDSHDDDDDDRLLGDQSN